VPRRHNGLRGTALLKVPDVDALSGILVVNLHGNEPSLSGEPASGGLTIRLSNISKFYSGVPALRGVSVGFYAGEVHAILGENGAGKSTLMNIISGTVHPESGEIWLGDRQITKMSPEIAASLGISISFQHPAILNDLSVLENLQVALPASVFTGKPEQIAAEQMLDAVGLHVPLRTRAETLTVAQKHLLEIAKALAIKPKILLLDEPTASLDQDSTEMLFERIRGVVKTGTSVIYITHRLAELRQIAQRVTVLRDGRVRGGGLVADIGDHELLAMIVGRTLGSAFPPKLEKTFKEVIFSVKSLNGSGFYDISFEAERGQIVGVAGVEGNGQSQLMRALAGLQPSEGAINLLGRSLTTRGLLQKAAFIPSDRHSEGLAAGLTVRENAAFAALDKLSSFGIMNKKKELNRVAATFNSLAVKTPSIEAPILSLSGGNQQKVVMSRALLSGPGLIVADEPTQGVDVGARAEIYRILREVSSSGTPVIVNSSDAAELEGLCDKVIVLSRGRAVATLTGADISEARIVAAAVSATSQGATFGLQDKARSAGSSLRHFLQSDNAPAVPLALVTILLGLYVFSQNANFLSAFNLNNILSLATALGFIALGQTITLLLGAIDLSVGPLCGFLVVVASFFINDDKSTLVIAAGFALIFFGAFVVGAINGTLIRFANFTPIAATLAMYIGLQGMSFLLRENPGGYINADVVQIITWQFGPIPASFIALVVIAVASEYTLRKTSLGWRLRATGSNEESARRVGVSVDGTFLLGYICCSLYTAIGAVMLMSQIGVGDPRQGINYTLSSITAVVLGGTSLRGGRGTFIGTVLGAVLLTEVLDAVSFLGFTETYQYVFQGALIVSAALIYSSVLRRSRA
jgi:ABC-type sugar transport system ATPase subunit/ribose/xylose/arabinose/galactoside ABC-type transport system permease subunit